MVTKSREEFSSLTPNIFTEFEKNPIAWQRINELQRRYASNPKRRRLTRREFVGLALAAGGLAFLGGYKRIEDVEGSEQAMELLFLTMSELIERAYNLGEHHLDVGIFPDFRYLGVLEKEFSGVPLRQEFNPWESVEKLDKAVEGVKTISIFFSIEDSTTPKYRDVLIQQINDIHARGYKVIISLGTYSSPNGKHPFHPDNEDWMRLQSQNFFTLLDQFHFPITIRWMYEMNLPNSTKYGRWEGMFDNQHEDGYRRAARIFREEANKSPHLRRIGFSPSAIHPFEKYWEEDIYDEAGPDGYDFSIESKNELDKMHPNVLEKVEHVTDPLYWLWGIKSPVQMFDASFASMARLTNGKIPFGLYEIGARPSAWQEDWITYSLLLLFSYGGTFANIFNYNKEDQQAIFPFEKNWWMTDLLFRKLAVLVPLLNSLWERPLQDSLEIFAHSQVR